MNDKEILITWLNNAYAMELSLAKTLEGHIDSLGDQLPEIRKELEKHIEETKDQAARVKDEITRLGGDTSSIRETMAEVFGSLSGMSTMGAKDRIVKNAIAEYSAEHFETATYMAIAQFAEMCGEEETARVAREIAEEEKTTGEKLKTKLKTIIETFRESQ